MKTPTNKILNENQMNEPLVSIVITAKNEAKTVENCIKSLLNQTYKNFEIIFIDARSIDKTFEKVTKLEEESRLFPNCKRYIVISTEANTPAKGRNIGVKQAHGEIIAFTDADCIPNNNWIINLLKNIPKNKGMVGGPNIIKHFKNSRILFAIDAVFSSYLGSGGSAQFLKIDKSKEVSAIAACNMAIHKNLFEEIGGFDEALRYNEDSNLCNQIRKKGHKIIYSPEAKISHFMGIESFSNFVNLIYKYGFERGKNVKRNPNLITRFNAISLGIAFFFIAIVIGSFFSNVAQSILAVTLTILIGLILGTSIKIGIKKKSMILSILPFPIFISIHIIYNFAFIKGYFSK